MTRTIVPICLVFVLAAAGCGKSKKERDCEKLKERTVLISSGIAEKLQKLAPQQDRVSREKMQEQMRKKLDEGDFMHECMKLDPKEVDCLATASTQEQWVECGFDQQMLP
jgi:hypothetical protein